MTTPELSGMLPVSGPALQAWNAPLLAWWGLQALAAGLVVAAALVTRDGGERSRPVRALPSTALLVTVAALVALGRATPGAVTGGLWRSFQWTSALSWGAWLGVLAVLPLGLWAFSGVDSDTAAGWMRSGLGRRLNGLRLWTWRQEAGLRRLALGLGVAQGLDGGLLLSTLSARPAWNSAALGPWALVNAAVVGMALALAAGLHPEERQRLLRLTHAGLALQLALVGLYLVDMAQGGRGVPRGLGSAALGVGVLLPGLLLRGAPGAWRRGLAALLVVAGSAGLRGLLLMLGDL